MKTRTAIFGSGRMSRIYADIIQNNPSSYLVGFVGNTIQKSESLSREYGVPVYSVGDYRGFLSNHKVDALIIATPEWVRLDPIQAALDFQIPMLIEKPFSQSWEEAKKLYELLHSYQQVLQFCHVLRFSPRFDAMKKMISNGDLGELRHMSSRRNSNNVNVRRLLGKASLAFWLTPHDIDVMRWLTSSEIQSVYSLSRGTIDTADDYIVSLLRFSNGITAAHEISWITPPLSPSANEIKFEARGTNGAIVLNDSENNITKFSEGSRVESADTYEHFCVQGHYHGFFRIMIDNFIQRVQLGLKNSQDLEDALETTRVCEMMRRSIILRREIIRDEVV
jgi:predicted dehydrogenase